MKSLKITFYVFIFISIISSCAKNEDETESTTTNSIIGTWNYVDNSSCTDSTVFRSDLSFTITSNEEILTGTYTYDETVKKGERHKLVFTFATDNLKTDCLGSTEDDTGSVMTFFLEFNNNTFSIYQNSSGGDNLLTFTKQ